MKKPFNAFNYACTYWGICHFIVVALLGYAIYVLLSSDEPVFLKVFSTLLLLFTAGDIIMHGVENIKKGIDKAHTDNDIYEYSNDQRS